MTRRSVLKKVLTFTLFLIMLVGLSPITANAAGVEIPDANFKAYLNKLLKQEATAEITAEQIATIEKIELPSGVTDVSGVENCTNLTFFRSWDKGTISGLDNLGSLTSLDYLCINKGGLTNISFVKSLSNLRTLNIWNNRVEDISVLAGLSNLKTVDVCYNKIYDLSPLTGIADTSTYLHAHDQRITFNETCDCESDPCTRRYPNPLVGLHGEVLTPKNVRGATYDPDTNEFILDAGVTSFTYEFAQLTKAPTGDFEVDFENVFSGKVTFNIEHVEAVKYSASHSFISKTTGRDLPQTIIDMVPADQTGIKNGTEVTPTEPKQREVAVAGGKWIFEGYTPSTATIDGSDVSFIGAWSFVATEAPIAPKPSDDPATGITPKTGDGSFTAVWLLLAITAVAGIIVINRKVVR